MKETEELQLLVWEDIETTGLKVGEDHLLEVAFVVTDTDFTVYGEFERLVLPEGGGLPREQLVKNAYSAASGIVQEMHTTNNLWQDCQQYGQSLHSVGVEASLWIKGLLAQLGQQFHIQAKPMLAGASLHALDWPMLHKNLPHFMESMHYRVVDMSSLKRAFEFWSPEQPHASIKMLPPNVAHRAMPDCRTVIAEAKTFRQYLQEGA